MTDRTKMVLLNLFVEDILGTISCHRISEVHMYYGLLVDSLTAADEIGIKRWQIYSHLSPIERRKLRRMLRNIDELDSSVGLTNG